MAVAALMLGLANASAQSAAPDKTRIPGLPVPIMPPVQVRFEGTPEIRLDVTSAGLLRTDATGSRVRFQVFGAGDVTISAAPGGAKSFVRIPARNACFGAARGVDPTNRKEALGYKLTLRWPSDGLGVQTASIDTDCPGGPTRPLTLHLNGRGARSGEIIVHSNREWNPRGADLPLPGGYVGSVVLTVTTDNVLSEPYLQ
jgi:hypothetical protein